MITADQLLAHAVGDYILQSDWMAKNKTKSDLAALAHAMTYGLPFLFLVPPAPYSWPLFVIVLSHYVIDRYRLARFVCWLKNGPLESVWDMSKDRTYVRWVTVTSTGYPADAPVWQAVWLLIIADNILHVAINGAALMWLQ